MSLSVNFQEVEHGGISLNYEKNLPLEDSANTCDWIRKVVNLHQYEVHMLNYIFCSDDELLKINIEHLNHDTYTDIITFDYTEEEGVIEGDIYISVDRVAENAKTFNKSFDDELHRVLIHGVLHLLGFGDKTDEEKLHMREKENACLSLREI